MTTNSLEEDLRAKKTVFGVGNVIAKELNVGRVVICIL
jgi:hypothetical protein